MRLQSSAAVAVSVLGTILVACAAELALEGRPCPCAVGYACCSARNVCLPEGSTCDGATDAADASPDAPFEASPGCPPLQPRLCSLARGKANVPLTIEVNGIGPCTVKLNAWLIELTVTAQPTNLGPPRLGCTENPKTTCTLPPLQERGGGSPYDLRLFRAGVLAGFDEADGSGQLFVRTDGTQESCSLDDDDPPFDLSPYSKACSSDDECVAVPSTACDPCGPRTEALATKDLAQSGFFDVERAARSECWRGIQAREGDLSTCSGTPPARAVCNQGACEVAR